MTKEQFLKYVHEAVDAMGQQDLEQLFPNQQRPDLYTLLEALVGLRGEVKKVAQTSLKLQNEVKFLVDKMQEAANQEESAPTSPPPDPAAEKGEKRTESDLRYILRELIKLESTVEKTRVGLEDLPELNFFQMNQYKTQFAAWEMGFNLFEKQWKALLKSTGMYQTGKVGSTFNPEYHEAVATAYDPQAKENAILETEQIGYLYKERLIQQAKVVVNKKQ